VFWLVQLWGLLMTNQSFPRRWVRFLDGFGKLKA
jgi:hypothetical protein